MAHSAKIAGTRTEARIARLTLFFGAAAAAAAFFLEHRAWAEGLAIGAVLGWLNFRWLGRGLNALVTASTVQEGREKPQVPLSAYFMALFRYALIGLTVYVIFVYRNIPLASMVFGMCALAAAAIVASVWEIFAPVDR